MSRVNQWFLEFFTPKLSLKSTLNSLKIVVCLRFCTFGKNWTCLKQTECRIQPLESSVLVALQTTLVLDRFTGY